MEWRSTPYSQQHSVLLIREDIHTVRLPPGKHIDCTLDAFSLFFDKEITDMIVKYTNIEGQRVAADKWKRTDPIEVRAFIGLVINAGLKKGGISKIGEFWDPLHGNPLFRACMSRNRFANLRRHLRFDDKSTRSARRDKFAPFRDFWEIVNQNLSKHYIPGPILTIDEQLVPYRGKVSFLQYVPSKPDKYGIKIFWICDSSNSYPLNGIPYLGQERPNREQNMAQRCVEELCTPFQSSNRCITYDNFFTSCELAQSLLKMGLTSVGALRKNKNSIPPAFLPHRHREVESNIFGFRKNITLVSYVPKKNKAVLLLSTLHHNAEIDVNNKNKSTINTFYNTTKVGVNLLDQMAQSFTARRKTNRWPNVLFYNLVDVCAIAAKII
ncbi:piggyBac transposable element-derived protein 4-like [Glossina fuscipes]|uniref:PiggyBac transposable element-derived protein 4-like n=1 Tax=Glossina fuscipes TaxID=7396 RepID=A0A8U0WC70_9MUSC|nr:piggyBac transposable element-derived protein 4-like [Glossina fuscipes]